MRLVHLDADEENALEIVQTRLRTMKCKWGKCDGILNSAQRAYRHLLIHGEAIDGTFLCQWDGCGVNLKSFSKWQVHAASHTLQPILCAYESCEESYTDALSYIHHSLERHRNDDLRLSSNPVMPIDSVDLANIPSSLPSYRSVHRSISQYPVSAERHATLGVWVLKNITGDVDLPDKRKELPTGAQLRERHKYDYLDELARPSINPSKGVQFRKMDDLDTGAATRLFHEGLVLWPSQAMLKEEEERAKKAEAEALVKIEKEPIQEEGQPEARTREAVVMVRGTVAHL
ncbi:hypothetical protein BDZ89DRAFT_608025 [Hymenopellis radicata]|nr:hypothetical protein BDZ89DRAFT_608025 [Hymenopellis radicata]